MSNEVIDNTLLPKLVKLYFSKYSTIDFIKIKHKTKEVNETLKKYTNSSIPSWLEGRAKDVSANTFNFIKNNKHLLSPSKNLFTCQEYQELLKFKPVLQNLDILTKEKNKIDLISKRTNKNTTRIVIALFIILFIFVLFINQIYQQLLIWNKDGSVGILGGLIFFVVLLYITSNIVISIFLGFLIYSILLACFPTQNLYGDININKSFFTYFFITLSTILITYWVAMIGKKGKKSKEEEINSSKKTINSSLNRV